MIGKALTTLFSLNRDVLKRNLQGVTQKDSLVHPEEGGNCINWVLGHVVANRNSILEIVGEEPVWSGNEVAPYARGSSSLHDTSQAHHLEKIVDALKASQERLLGALGSMSEDDFLASYGDEGATVGEQLVFFAFHESYHAGQIGILRRMIGKPGAIA